MIVAHVNTEQTWRGGEVQTAQLLAGLQDRGVTNVLIAQPGSEIAGTMQKDGIPVIELRMRGEWDLMAVGRLARALRKVRPDILQLHTSHAHTIGLLAGRLAHVRPIVVTRRIDHPIKGPLSALKYRGVDRIVAISEAIRSFLTDGGVPPEKVSVIHSVADCPEPYPQGDLRSTFGIDPGAPVIGTIAALAKRKGHRYLFEATRRLKQRHPDVRVLVVGKGHQENRLRRLAARLGLSETVLFTGFRQDIPQVLNTLDVFVMASEREGLGVALLEASCCGLPIIGSNVGGIPEIVKDGATGLLTPPADPEALADKLGYLLDHPAHARELGANAKAFVRKEFSLESMVRGYCQLYERLLS